MGAAWLLSHNQDPVGAIFSAGMAASALAFDKSTVVGPYTYIFHAQQEYA